MTAFPQWQGKFAVIGPYTRPEYVVGWDSETHLMGRGRMAPRMVCGSLAGLDFGSVLDGKRYVNKFHQILSQPKNLLVAHNLAYDLVVMAVADPTLLRPIFEGLRDNRFADTKIRQTLIDIEEGTFRGEPNEDGSWTVHGYGLDDLCIRHDLPPLDKSGDTWRLRYSELDGVPVEQYPKEAYDYSLLDSVAARNVYLKQRNGRPILNEGEQCRAAFALQLATVWGIRTDKENVLELERQLVKEADALMAEMQKPAIGIYRKDRTRDTKRLKFLVEQAFAKQGLPVPRTEPSTKFPDGQISTSADTLQLSGDPVLRQLGDQQGPFKLLSTFIPAIKAATEIPLQPGYEVMVVTGRTSSKNPVKKKKGEIPVGINIQQVPRDRRDDDGNVLLGTRNCFVPRLGRKLVSSDWSVAELRTLAEVQFRLFGQSALRDALIKGIDPHLAMAANILSKPLEWVLANKKTLDVKDARSFAKVANFGIPGGLGADALVAFGRATYGVIMTVEFARNLIAIFHQTWPEQQRLFTYIKQQIGPFEGPITQLIGCPLVHGARKFTKAANLMFQGPVAQIAKTALWRVQWEMYLGDDGWRLPVTNQVKPSPLFGSRTCAFIHDEILAEVLAISRKISHDAAMRLSELMNLTMNEYLVNTPSVCEPAMMDCWQKEAEMVLDSDGFLTSWKPEEKKAKAA